MRGSAIMTRALELSAVAAKAEERIHQTWPYHLP